jgi:putative ATP-dependent endonuclease of the OLD family
VPSEYYRVDWLAFSGSVVSQPSMPIGVSFIDSTRIRLQSGADHHLQSVIAEYLEPTERIELARNYRTTRESFSDLDSVRKINEKLALTKGDVSDRTLSLGINISQRFSWEGSLVAHADKLPIQQVGDGEQKSLKTLLALNREAGSAHVTLIEEPENHLSFSSLNRLVSKIASKCAGRQVIVATHSLYVLNKLGLGNLLLMTKNSAKRLASSPADTQDYFRKLSGYDTLRLVLANRVILVEGPSDELIVQRAYLNVHGKFSIHDGVDVISVRGLSFARFLDLAHLIQKSVVVVTDNDGKPASTVRARYQQYISLGLTKVCVGPDAGGRTLEPQMLSANSLGVLNSVLGTSETSTEDMLDYMKENKTSCALQFFESDRSFAIPQYILDAVA